VQPKKPLRTLKKKMKISTTSLKKSMNLEETDPLLPKLEMLLLHLLTMPNSMKEMKPEDSLLKLKLESPKENKN